MAAVEQQSEAQAPPRAMRILQVSPRDVFGGAERVAWNLAEGAQKRGMESWLAVGRRTSAATNVIAIPQPLECYGPWGRLWLRAAKRLFASRKRGAYRLGNLARWLAEPGRSYEQWHGIEDFRFPGSRRLMQLTPRKPDIVHCHNLHGNYFDLRMLATLSADVPVFLTLHDAWLLTGHCSHSMDCDRWKTGCGECPDLTLYPAIRRDATAFNWRRKHEIYRRSRLYVATPCHWLMNRVKQSMLADGLAESRVIPNGVNLEVFRPVDRAGARKALGLPTDARILLFAANQWIRQSRAKDYGTLREALNVVAQLDGAAAVILLALGESAPNERIGRAEVRFVPFQSDARVVASYFQAADIYVHSAHVDTFPTTILEALACGTPVVATGICGIPEQIRGLRPDNGSDPLNHAAPAEATGILVPPANVMALSGALQRLLENQTLRTQLGENARRDGCRRFDLERQIDAYAEWYGEVHARRRHEKFAHRHL